MRIAVIGATGLVGSAFVKAAEAEGHKIVALSKDTGFDVLDRAGCVQALQSVDAVVDVVQSPSLEEQEATEFFTKAATNIGEAAREAGVQRSVVLSIIGVDKIAAADEEAGTGFDGYYRAKYAHEQATVANAPNAHVVRSAQFFDISRQAIGWGRDGDNTTVPDLVTQPVAVDAMVQVLLDAATGNVTDELTEVAGPHRETLAKLSSAYAERTGDPVRVTAAPVGDMVSNGVLLPGANARLVGPSFGEWLDATAVRS
ncbi:SDR family oxidoreductase [Alloalcanivorax gelatiniphagus]